MTVTPVTLLLCVGAALLKESPCVVLPIVDVSSVALALNEAHRYQCVYNRLWLTIPQ